MEGVGNSANVTIPDATRVATSPQDPVITNEDFPKSSSLGNGYHTFRKLYSTVVLDDSSAAGTRLFSIPLDVTLDSSVTSFASYYMEYKINRLSFNLGNTSPMSSASGAIFVGYNPDPSNLLSASNAAGNINKVARLIGSKQVRAREMVTMAADENFLSGRRYCLPAGYPRIESYGSLDICVYAPAQGGDSASFPIVIEADFEFFHPTFQTITPPANFYDVRLLNAAATPMLNGRFVRIPIAVNALPRGNGFASLDGYLRISPTGSRDFSVNSALFSNNGTNAYLLVSNQSRSNGPYKVVMSANQVLLRMN